MSLCSPKYLREKARLACTTSGHKEALCDAADEIERLQKLVDLAVDAYSAGGEDECCVACMKIYEQKDAALA